MLRRLTGYLLLILTNIDYSNAKHNHKEMRQMVGKIVGGNPVPKKMFPSMVQLYNNGNICAGSILNSWTVMTAAHCFDYNTNTEELLIQTDSRYIYDFNSDTYGVSTIVIHEQYNETRNFACDIALVFSKKPIKFSKNSKKGVLVDSLKWMNVNERNFSAAGWGTTKYGGHLSENGLMMTYLRFIPNDECGKMHEMTFSEDMFCLYGEGMTDTCKGDSGGGVLWHTMIVGITSHGNGCAKKLKPSVYTNVFFFRRWIEKEVNKFVKTYCHNSTLNSYI